MKIIVLGSRGVIGKSLVELLKNEGHIVKEVDVQIDPTHDLSKNEINFIDVDFVFFLAYDVGGSKYISNPKKDFIDTNMKIMLNVFNYLEKSKIPFIFASSQLQNTYTSYGCLKQIGEHYTTLLGGKSVRFWNIYGYENVSEKSHVIPDFISQFKTTGKIVLLTDGTEDRQFLHSRDCAKCLETIMQKYKDMKNIIDISSFEWISIKELALKITNNIEIINIKSQFQTKNEPDRYILNFWNPKISLDIGLKELLDIY